MPRLLFLCTGNSCRSQMAEGFGRKYAPPGWFVESAGTNPQGLHRLAAQVMGELGIDIAAQKSTAIDAEGLLSYDAIITLCGEAEEACPMTPPGIQRLHWPIADPAKATGSREEVLSAFREVRDEIKERVRRWANQIEKS